MLLKALNFEQVEENESVTVKVQLSDIADFPVVMFTSEYMDSYNPAVRSIKLSHWAELTLHCDLNTWHVSRS